MAWRVNVDPHPMTKYTLSEGDLFKHLCTMDPIYNRHAAEKDVIPQHPTVVKHPARVSKARILKLKESR